MCVQNTDQFVCAALGKPFKSNCSWRKATGNHLHICTSHVYNDASAMTVSSQTCLRAENSSSLTSIRNKPVRWRSGNASVFCSRDHISILLEDLTFTN